MRSATGLPRRRAKAASASPSKRAMRARTPSGTSGTLGTLLTAPQLRGDEREELFGLGRVATPGGAVRPERAPLAQARRAGLEVLGLAGSLDGVPDRRGPLLQTLDRLLGRLGDDGDRVLEVQQLDPVGAAPEQALAQERVEVNAPEPSLLVTLPGRVAALVAA